MSEYYVGKGSAGTLTLSSSRTEDTTIGVEAITSLTSSGQADVIVADGSTFSAGDWVLIIQMQGTGAGNYEQAKIASISTNTLTMEATLTNTYQSTNAQVVKMAQYHSVTINSGGVWTASSWDGTTGGVLAAMCRGNLTVDSGGSIEVDAKGFRGGAAVTAANTRGNSGEGTGGDSVLASFDANGNGGGGGIQHVAGEYNANGGSGGGHSSEGSAGTRGESGGTTSGSANLSTMTFGGAAGSGGSRTNNVGGEYSGKGGRGGGIIFLIVGGNISISDNVSASGGDGDDAPLPNSDQRGGAGGAGAGGSIRFVSEGTIALNSTNVAAPAGTGGTSFATHRDGYDGSAGRIATLAGATVTGTSVPSIDESSTDTTTTLDSTAKMPLPRFYRS